jgi:hypothetical protein
MNYIYSNNIQSQTEMVASKPSSLATTPTPAPSTPTVYHNNQVESNSTLISKKSASPFYLPVVSDNTKSNIKYNTFSRRNYSITNITTSNLLKSKKLSSKNTSNLALNNNSSSNKLNNESNRLSCIYNYQMPIMSSNINNNIVKNLSSSNLRTIKINSNNNNLNNSYDSRHLQKMVTDTQQQQQRHHFLHTFNDKGDMNESKKSSNAIKKLINPSLSLVSSTSNRTTTWKQKKPSNTTSDICNLKSSNNSCANDTDHGCDAISDTSSHTNSTNSIETSIRIDNKKSKKKLFKLNKKLYDIRNDNKVNGPIVSSCKKQSQCMFNRKQSKTILSSPSVISPLSNYINNNNNNKENKSNNYSVYDWHQREAASSYETSSGMNKDCKLSGNTLILRSDSKLSINEDNIIESSSKQHERSFSRSSFLHMNRKSSIECSSSRESLKSFRNYHQRNINVNKNRHEINLPKLNSIYYDSGIEGNNNNFSKKIMYPEYYQNRNNNNNNNNNGYYYQQQQQTNGALYNYNNYNTISSVNHHHYHPRLDSSDYKITTESTFYGSKFKKQAPLTSLSVTSIIGNKTKSSIKQETGIGREMRRGGQIKERNNNNSDQNVNDDINCFDINNNNNKSDNEDKEKIRHIKERLILASPSRVLKKFKYQKGMNKDYKHLYTPQSSSMLNLISTSTSSSASSSTATSNENNNPKVQPRLRKCPNTSEKVSLDSETQEIDMNTGDNHRNETLGVDDQNKTPAVKNRTSTKLNISPITTINDNQPTTFFQNKKNDLSNNRSTDFTPQLVKKRSSICKLSNQLNSSLTKKNGMYGINLNSNSPEIERNSKKNTINSASSQSTSSSSSTSFPSSSSDERKVLKETAKTVTADMAAMTANIEDNNSLNEDYKNKSRTKMVSASTLLFNNKTQKLNIYNDKLENKDLKDYKDSKELKTTTTTAKQSSSVPLQFKKCIALKDYKALYSKNLVLKKVGFHTKQN